MDEDQHWPTWLVVLAVLAGGAIMMYAIMYGTPDLEPSPVPTVTRHWETWP